MSREMTQMRALEMAKAKKSKDGSARKRKREDEQAASAEVNSEPTTKKLKKRKSKGGDDTRTEQAQLSVPVVSSGNLKKPRGSQDEQTEPSPVEVKERKKKKEKKIDQADATVPVGGSGKYAAMAENSKSKKVRSPSESQVAAGSPKDVDHSAENHVKLQIRSKDALKRLTPFKQHTSSFYLALSPCVQSFPIEGLSAEHISPLLLTYFAPLKGVVLSYSNLRLSEGPDDLHPSSSERAVLAQSIDEYAVNFVWLTADFTIFRPSKGTYLEGYVNLQNESLLGLVCYNYFNAGIDRTRLPSDWRWMGNEEAAGKSEKGLQEGEGYWVNGEGERVEGGLVFKVKDFEPTPAADGTIGSINITGTLLSEADDRELDEQESKRR